MEVWKDMQSMMVVAKRAGGGGGAGLRFGLVVRRKPGGIEMAEEGQFREVLGIKDEKGVRQGCVTKETL